MDFDLEKVLDLEKQAYDDAKTKGINQGTQQGFKEGFDFGIMKGRSLGEEIGHIAGFVDFYLQFSNNSENKKLSERLVNILYLTSSVIKTLKLLKQMLEDFPLGNAKDDTLITKYEKIKTKFKVLEVKLGIHSKRNEDLSF